MMEFMECTVPFTTGVFGILMFAFGCFIGLCIGFVFRD